jgi:hypothetical protein
MATAALLAGCVGLSSCSGNSAEAKTDPGTLAGTYNVTITATGNSGTTPYTVSIGIPVTVQ